MLIGIDLGTTNSLAACFQNGKVEIIPNRLGGSLTPSVVSVDENGQILVGETAREFGYLHPDRMARLFKRTMGTDKKYTLGEMTFSSEELSAFVLRSLKEDAETYLKEEVSEAIISVPAYFNDRQRRATKQAGELAGLNVSRIINEPTASAIAYGIGESGTSECCMVLDLGGGTFDVTVLEYYRNIMEVYAVAGDNVLGGEDFTMVLTEMFLNRIAADQKIMDLRTLSNIYKAAESCKREFSRKPVSLMSASVNGIIYEEEFSLSEYETACLGLLEKLRKPVEKALRDARITLNDLDRIILVGGATRLPLVRSYIQRMTGIYPEYSVDPDTAVAEGAALSCAMKERQEEIQEVILTDVCPFTLGTEVISGSGAFMEEGRYLPIIERNTVIPVSRSQTVYTAYDDQEWVRVKVLQGESRIAANNLKIGELSVEVPKGPRGQEAIEITYTYDINSLLEVEVRVVSTGLEKKIIIQDEENRISDQEAEERLQRLQYLKQNPREDEENVYALLKTERIYEEASGKDRTVIEEAAASFEETMRSGTRLDVAKKRQELLELLDSLEKGESARLLS
ncbi:MAG: molecular chaperone HscC [Erysipelotrichaceae bacterium]|nr:molecular chaperone HscC [Erysipelotrichaceae bacterium]